LSGTIVNRNHGKKTKLYYSYIIIVLYHRAKDVVYKGSKSAASQFFKLKFEI